MLYNVSKAEFVVSNKPTLVKIYNKCITLDIRFFDIVEVKVPQ